MVAGKTRGYKSDRRLAAFWHSMLQNCIISGDVRHAEIPSCRSRRLLHIVRLAVSFAGRLPFARHIESPLIPAAGLVRADGRTRAR